MNGLSMTQRLLMRAQCSPKRSSTRSGQRVALLAWKRRLTWLWRELMDNLPSGTVTFLFTDIEGSTKLAQQYPNEMPVLLARHHEILHQSTQMNNGYVFHIVGDSFAMAFHSASNALNSSFSA